MSELQSLIERVEKATGPDREIDAALHVALLTPEQYPDDLRYFRLPHVSMDHMDMCAPGTYWLKQRSGASLHTSPAYTSSLDAALSLVSRALPGWGIEVLMSDRQMWSAQVWRWFSETNDERGQWLPCYSRTPALAIILALLRAKAAEQATAPADAE